jgi:hypothetical protein
MACFLMVLVVVEKNSRAAIDVSRDDSASEITLVIK